MHKQIPNEIARYLHMQQNLLAAQKPDRYQKNPSTRRRATECHSFVTGIGSE